ncbi:carbohydrate ABC transporter permease [Homoserinibacter gongjuensis]|jgi:multiple sugar transport system permease protein/alpha-1,4-digalacturonate transport system permease protein|uniref:ABC transporter permease n=1 Tax=Homoserinibacter gongjuensis TaxID=1162968 RepID=A0ABQ6JUW2_9MICO|nr:sugar ABC transporter permease [Homoserinibacter gongjuensis]GMA90520.1 ABC transporter permease [Homoserinibacter gongjuensis]
MTSAVTGRVGTPSPRRSKLRLRNTVIGWSFILPNFLGFALITLIPVVQLFFISLTDQNIFGKGDFVGIANFQKLMGDPLFQRSFVNTLYFAVLHVPLTIVVSLGLALLLNSKLRGVAFFRTAAFFPYITSIVAVGLVWNLLFSPEYGPINEVLRFFGVADPPGWLLSQDWAMPAIVIISTWRDMGYYMILFLAGLQTVSPELYEAARMDGANVFQRFWNVTLPGIRPTMFLVTVLLTIASFKIFDLIIVLSPGGTAAPNMATVVLSQFIYQRGFIESKFGYASSAAVVLFVLCIVTTVIQFLINKKRSA